MACGEELVEDGIVGIVVVGITGPVVVETIGPIGGAFNKKTSPEVSLDTYRLSPFAEKAMATGRKQPSIGVDVRDVECI